MKAWSKDDREWYEERAAIYEHEGGMNRREAEREARRQVNAERKARISSTRRTKRAP